MIGRLTKFSINEKTTGWGPEIELAIFRESIWSPIIGDYRLSNRLRIFQLTPFCKVVSRQTIIEGTV